MKKILACLALLYGMNAYAAETRKWMLYNQTPFAITVDYPIQQVGFKPGTDRIAPDTAGNIGSWNVEKAGEVIIQLGLLRRQKPIYIRISTTSKIKPTKKFSVFSFRFPGTTQFKSWRDLRKRSSSFIEKLSSGKKLYFESIRGKKDGEVSFFLKTK